MLKRCISFAHSNHRLSIWGLKTKMNISVPTTTVIPPPTTEIRYFLSLTYLILSAIGLVLNVILLFVLFKNRNNNPSQLAFFLIAANMTSCDTGQLISQIVVAFPLSLFGTNVFAANCLGIYTFFTVLDTVCYNGVLWFTFLMSLHRFIVFLIGPLDRALFKNKRIYFTITFVWLVLATEVTVYNWLTCTKRFSAQGFYFYIRCSADPPHPKLTAVWATIMRQQSYILPCVMFLFYICIFIYLKTRMSIVHKTKTGDAHHRHKVEINMLIQSAIICFFLELQTLSFTFLPKLGSGYGTYYISLTQNIISIINNSINPYIYLYFNPPIRKGVYSLLRLRRGSDTKVMTITNKSVATVTS